jgi:hypothetical protein
MQSQVSERASLTPVLFDRAAGLVCSSAGSAWPHGVASAPATIRPGFAPVKEKSTPSVRHAQRPGLCHDHCNYGIGSLAAAKVAPGLFAWLV